MLSTLPCSAFLYLQFFGTVSSPHVTSFLYTLVICSVECLCVHVYACVAGGQNRHCGPCSPELQEYTGMCDLAT